MRVVTFKIEEDLLEQLDKYALAKGLNRSEAIRMMIREATSKMKDPPYQAKVEKGAPLR